MQHMLRFLRPTSARFAEKSVAPSATSSAPSFFGKPSAFVEPVKPAAEKVAEKATEAAAKPSAPFRTRAAAFFTGVAVTAVFGYIRLRQDVWSSSADIKARVAAAHGDVSVLLARIHGLEKRINVLEEREALKGAAVVAAAAPKAKTA